MYNLPRTSASRLRNDLEMGKGLQNPDGVPQVFAMYIVKLRSPTSHIVLSTKVVGTCARIAHRVSRARFNMPENV